MPLGETAMDGEVVVFLAENLLDGVSFNIFTATEYLVTKGLPFSLAATKFINRVQCFLGIGAV